MRLPNNRVEVTELVIRTPGKIENVYIGAYYLHEEI
jgi:hypothetical protein